MSTTPPSWSGPAVELSLEQAPPQLLRLRDSDPYPRFAWLRRNAPLMPERKRSGLSVWHVARHADVRRLLPDARLSKRPELAPGYVPGPAGLNRHLVHADPPEHARLRRVADRRWPTPDRFGSAGSAGRLQMSDAPPMTSASGHSSRRGRVGNGSMAVLTSST